MIDLIETILKNVEKRSGNKLPKLYDYNSNAIFCKFTTNINIVTSKEIEDRILNSEDIVSCKEEDRMYFNNRIFMELYDLYILDNISRRVCEILPIDESLLKETINSYKKNKEFILSGEILRKIFKNEFKSRMFYELDRISLYKNPVHYYKERLFSNGKINTYIDNADEFFKAVDKYAEDQY